MMFKYLFLIIFVLKYHIKGQDSQEYETYDDLGISKEGDYENNIELAEEYIESQWKPEYDEQFNRLLKEFNRYDKNKDGFITKYEMKAMIKKKQEQEFKLYVEIFKLADSDGSGKINFKEFLETSFDLEDELNEFKEEL